MTDIQRLGFIPNAAPIKIKTAAATYEALSIDWIEPRANWPASSGLMAEVADNSTGALPGQRLRVFVPWWNIQFISQVIPPVVDPESALKK